MDPIDDTIPQSPLKVVWVSLEWPSPSRHSGGVGRYLKRLAEDMKDLVDLTIVTQRDPEFVDGVRFVEVPALASRIDRYYRAPLRFNSIVRALSPDLIHAHGDDWGIHTSVPIVRSFYGTSWSEARTSKGLRRLNHFILAGLEHYSARKATTKLAIAPESMNAFRCDYLIPPLAHRPARVPRQPSTVPHVVFIGSYYGRKRGFIAQAAVEDARRALGREVRLSVIGPVEDAPNWDTSVRHMSSLTDQQVQQVLASAWVLLAPSEYEGFGIPVVEALNLGVPVIASATPGSKHIVETGGGDLPMLLLTSDVELTDALIRRIEAGPDLSPAERRSAIACCDQLYDQASANKLHQIYLEAKSRR